jgi:hypothetical protein
LRRIPTFAKRIAVEASRSSSNRLHSTTIVDEIRHPGVGPSLRRERAHGLDSRRHPCREVRGYEGHAAGQGAGGRRALPLPKQDDGSPGAREDRSAGRLR